MNPFEQRKIILLNSPVFCDNSLKKSIDQGVVPLCNFLNNHPNYYTTSSCSGRIVLYRQNQGKHKHAEKNPWLLISHDPITSDQLLTAAYENKEIEQVVYFKFEPMVMHVEARDLASAQKLLQIACQAGFRNSGISISARFIVAIRCTLKLDVPLKFSPNVSNLFENVSDDYLKWLVSLANEKMLNNNQLIDRLQKDVESNLLIVRTS